MADEHAYVTFDEGTEIAFKDLVRETLNRSDFIDAIDEGGVIEIYGYEEPEASE